MSFLVVIKGDTYSSHDLAWGKTQQRGGKEGVPAWPSDGGWVNSNWILPPLCNSWITLIMQLYMAHNMTHNKLFQGGASTQCSNQCPKMLPVSSP